MVTLTNISILGDGARLAARSAVHGCIEYLNTSVFGLTPECTAASTKEVFVCLLRSLWEAHDCILEVGGALTTLTVAVILPLGGENTGRYAVCACNVGDSLATCTPRSMECESLLKVLMIFRPIEI